MTYELSDEEAARVQALEGADQYRYAVEKIRETGELWLLGDHESVATFRNAQGEAFVYVWPHPRFAAEHASGAWAQFEPFEVSLSEFFQTSYPYLIQRGLKLGVFFNRLHLVTVVSPEDLESHLRNGVP